jgi:hypothetical protein
LRGKERDNARGKGIKEERERESERERELRSFGNTFSQSRWRFRRFDDDNGKLYSVCLAE